MFAILYQIISNFPQPCLYMYVHMYVSLDRENLLDYSQNFEYALQVH